MLECYTDGGNSAKHGVGGCAAVIVKDRVIMAELSEAHTNNPTNNIEELAGVILGLTYVLEHPELGKDITVISDSEYIVNGATKWLDNWARKGWKSTTGLVKNRTLWEAILYLKGELNVTFKWVKGHSNSALNNLADHLATTAYRKLIK